MAAALPNVSADLIWEVVRNQNAYLVNRNDAGGLQLSRDPLNLVNKHSRKYAGFVNDKAIGVVPNEKGGVKVISKNQKNANKPAQGTTEVTYGGNKSARKPSPSRPPTVATVPISVQRVSAIRRAQKPVKPEAAEKKPRGVKAKKAAEKTEA
uniref:60s ribosomal protein l28 n=1 Tax=Colletotrichum fructicola (strain Nara gc5) TaxID=1213859 RepID=L2FZW9_COLFN